MSSLHSLKKKINSKRKHAMPNPKLNSIAPGIFPGVRPEDLTVVTCKNCGEEATKFLPVCSLRHASRFQTSVGQPMLINFNEGFACVKCGKINEFTVPGVTEKESISTKH